jgi:hypothetical protein
MEGFPAEWDAYDRKFAFDLTWDTQRALAVDELWTEALATPQIRGDVRANFPLLQTVVEEMVISLRDITSRSGELEDLIDRKEVNLDEALARVREAGLYVPHPGSLRDVVGEACRVLREESENEIEAIHRKLMDLGRDELVSGDWSPKVTKALKVVAGTAGLVVVAAMPGILLVPATVGTAAAVVGAVTQLAQVFD